MKGGALAKLYVGGGRKLKIRPGDLVGAITGEMGIDAISLDRFRRAGVVAVLLRALTAVVPVQPTMGPGWRVGHGTTARRAPEQIA